MRAAVDGRLGDIGARRNGAFHRGTAQLQQFRSVSIRSAHPPDTWVPPTVIDSILIVGQPTPTGTD